MNVDPLYGDHVKHVKRTDAPLSDTEAEALRRRLRERQQTCAPHDRQLKQPRRDR